MRDGAWELQQICTNYDIWFLDRIHRVFAATSVIVWLRRSFCSFEATLYDAPLGFSWGKGFVGLRLFPSDGALILRASCTGAKRQWSHFMSVNCSERVFARLLFDW